MSMLTMQIDELRKAARNIQGNLGRHCYRRKDVNEMQQVSDMLRGAADTIESLRDRFQNQAFALGMQEALGSGTCEQVLTDYDDGLIPLPTAHCSACGAEWGFTPKYCHNCGAKVVGVRDERKAVER